MTIMLDKKDAKILKELKKNSRETTKHISETIKIPRVTVYERIQKMINRGVIKSFTAVPDYNKIGLPFKAFIFLKLEKDPDITNRQISYKISRIPGIYEVHIISGEYDLLLKVRGQNLDDISKLVIDKLRVLKGISGTLTMTVFETIKEEV